MWYAVSHNDTERDHAAKGERPLRQRYRYQTWCAKTVLHCGLERVGAGQLGINDNETDGPVDRDCQRDEQYDPHGETGSSECVGLSNNPSTNDRVCHIHERTPYPTLGPRIREMLFGLELKGVGAEW